MPAPIQASQQVRSRAECLSVECFSVLGGVWCNGSASPWGLCENTSRTEPGSSAFTSIIPAIKAMARVASRRTSRSVLGCNSSPSSL